MKVKGENKAQFFSLPKPYIGVYTYPHPQDK